MDESTPDAPIRGTILLVDDDVDALTLLSNVLEKQGHRTFLARDGASALELAREVSGTLDTIVLDILMPGTLNGYDVLEALRADPRTAPIPVLILSAMTGNDDIAQSYRSGAFQHVCKPCDLDHFSIMVQNIVRLRQVERTAQQNAEKYAAILNHTPVDILLLSPDLRILEMNRNFMRNFPDAKLGDLLFETFFDTPPDAMERHPLREVLRTGEMQRGDVVGTIRGERKCVQVRAAPIKDRNGTITALVHISMDMTASHQMEENLRKQVDRYNRALQLQDQTTDHLMEVQRELKQKKIELERLSITDGLTGLFNRREFDRVLEAEARRSARYKHPLSVAMIDIDHFKLINDTHGHQAGDDILRDMARILIKSLRETDTVARYGGEEFIIILPETDYETALSISDRLRESVEVADFQTQKGILQITVSIGVTSITRKAINPARLVASADEALYAAKEGGRNRVVGACALKSKPLPSATAEGDAEAIPDPDSESESESDTAGENPEDD